MEEKLTAIVALSLSLIASPTIATTLYILPGQCQTFDENFTLCALNCTQQSCPDFNRTCWSYFNSSLSEDMQALLDSFAQLNSTCSYQSNWLEDIANHSAVSELAECKASKYVCERQLGELEPYKQSFETCNSTLAEYKRYKSLHEASMAEATKARQNNYLYAFGGFVGGLGLAYYYTKRKIPEEKGLEVGRPSRMGM